MPFETNNPIYDLFIIGGGINGCGIARDAAGRGLSVMLAEQGDIAGEASSASTKLFHGGLRYLEYFEFKLVRESLTEREILHRASPHISRPMRFVLPYHRGMRFKSDTPASKLLRLIMPWMRGRRPSWMIRFGLILYDNLGSKSSFAGSKNVNLNNDIAGKSLQPHFKKAFEYSDCQVDDSRLVALTARDAGLHGAVIRTRNRVTAARVENGQWIIEVYDEVAGEKTKHQAKTLINAAGADVKTILKKALGQTTSDHNRLVRGSHIVTRRLFDHDKSYFLQGADGRIVFACPFEEDFTLIGTTDIEHPNESTRPECTVQEVDYLLDFVSGYLNKPVTKKDIVWKFSGVRSLYDDGAGKLSAVTRDYVLSEKTVENAPLINVFGGKITTHRHLSERAVDMITGNRSHTRLHWTKTAHLPGGDFCHEDFPDLVKKLGAQYPFLNSKWADRLVRAYGTDAFEILAGVESEQDLGRNFGADLTEREVKWMVEHEFAQTVEDVIWRRSKLGLRLTAEQISALESWMSGIDIPSLMQLRLS